MQTAGLRKTGCLARKAAAEKCSENLPSFLRLGTRADIDCATVFSNLHFSTQRILVGADSRSGRIAFSHELTAEVDRRETNSHL
jgi:hypothetical protein